MEYFDNSEQVQTKKYAFKCHRKSEAGRDVVFPVNAIAFHPIFGTFATGGMPTSSLVAVVASCCRKPWAINMQVAACELISQSLTELNVLKRILALGVLHAA